MKRVMLSMMAALVVLALALGAVSTARAANPPGTGQPSQSCQAQPSSPGNASSSPGSAFNLTSGVAGGVYAGQPGTPSSTNGSPKAVGQYDVACFQVSTNGH